MFGFWLVVLAVAAWFRPRRKRRAVELMYRQGEIMGDMAVFPCGCRFSWANPEQKPVLCSAHQAIVDAEVPA